MTDREDCIGCEICRCVCPVGAITMEYDREGFRYPKIDLSVCIGCNRCESACPVFSRGQMQSFKMKGSAKFYCGHFSDSRDTLKSSSGGFATALARNFIMQGGVVFGVTFASDFTYVYFEVAEAAEDLEKFRGSKYFQTRKEDVFNKIEKYLDKKRKVLFIGLPCDVGAVKFYFLKHPAKDRLFTCELICHGVTSEKILQDYLSYFQSENDTITDFAVRRKDKAWAPYFICTSYGSGKKELLPYDTSDFKLAFFNMLRSSCYHCRFKGNESVADISAGDYWGISEEDKAFQREGVSLIIIRNESMLSVIRNLDGFEIYNADHDITIGCNPSIEFSTVKSKYRSYFSDLYIKLGLKVACQKLRKKQAIRERNVERREYALGYLRKLKSIF